MDLLSVFSAPWAILPAKFSEIIGVVQAHMRGERADLAAIEARLGAPLANEQRPVQIENGVALLPLRGTLARRMNMMHEISGGTSTRLAAEQLRELAVNDRVRGVVLDIDSAGGEAHGIASLANAVTLVRNAGKPVIAWIDGMGCSAAYWVASAAERIYVADGTAIVGSIGVCYAHMDRSGLDALRGFKVTEITAGRYKRIQSEHAPLSAAGREYLQAQVDAVYTLFVEDVARNRRVPAGQVLERMADGRQFIGKQAIDAGLVDGEKSLDAIVTELQGRVSTGGVGAGAAGASAHTVRVELGTRVSSVPLRKDYFGLVLDRALAVVGLQGNEQWTGEAGQQAQVTAAAVEFRKCASLMGPAAK